MYANLRVEADGKVHYAWKIEVAFPARTIVYLDDPNQESDHAEPAGTLLLDPGTPFTITASF